jgi:hypothetical protein
MSQIRAILRILSTEGRGVSLCWEHSNSNGPKGRTETSALTVDHDDARLCREVATETQLRASRLRRGVGASQHHPQSGGIPPAWFSRHPYLMGQHSVQNPGGAGGCGMEAIVTEQLDPILVFASRTWFEVHHLGVAARANVDQGAHHGNGTE